MANISQLTAENLANRFVNATYDKLVDKHKRVASYLLEEALNHFYGKEQLEDFRKLPKTFHTLTSKFGMRIDGQYHYLYSDKDHIVPNSYDYTSLNEMLTDSKLKQSVLKWSLEYNRLRTECFDLRKKTKFTILGFKTEKRLREEWPDVAKYWPVSEQPTVQMGELAVRKEDVMKAIASARTPKEK